MSRQPRASFSLSSILRDRIPRHFVHYVQIVFGHHVLSVLCPVLAISMSEKDSFLAPTISRHWHRS